jgi:hypothetical protein
VPYQIFLATGGPDWVQAQGDYDGDSKTDFGVYNPTTGRWYALKSSMNYTKSVSIIFGGPGYTPVRGLDVDGDGKMELVTYQESTGTFNILLSYTGYTYSITKSWGGPGYTPIPMVP